MTIVNNILICNDFKKWEEIFYSFLNQNTDLLKFEEYIYNNPDMEKEIGTYMYDQFLLINYKENSSSTNVKDLINTIINKDPKRYNKWKICELIKKTGWKKEYSSYIDDNNKTRLPILFSELYGGIEIGENGKGLEQAKSNVKFLLKNRDSDLEDFWKEKIGEVFQVGTAHHENIILFMNNEGTFYIFIDVINRMYVGGNLEETLSKLLFGLNYGEQIQCP